MRALFLVVSLIVSTACSPRVGREPRSPLPKVAAPEFQSKPQSVVVAAPVTAPKTWTPEKIEIRCSSSRCLPQVGLLLFLVKQNKNGADLIQCTAALISPTRILTTGHCAITTYPGFFIAGEGDAKQVRKIKSLVYKKFEPGPAEQEKHVPAAAVFELNEPVSGIEPLKLASGAQRPISKLTAFVMNQDDSAGLKYRQDAVTCGVRRHEAYFPFDLDESPDLIWAFDCPFVRGNSGSPLLADGGTEIEAILQAVTTLDQQTETVRRQMKREPVPLENHSMMFSTNVRCLTLPDHAAAPCVRASDEEIRDRWIATQKAAVHDVMNRPYKDTRSGLKFRASGFPLAQNVSSYDQRFEIVYEPKCRLRELSAFAIPSEFVQISYDEWGTPRFLSLETRRTEAKIVARSGSAVEVEADWAASFGPLKYQSEHPRQRLGKRFPIDLPQCPR